MMGKFILSKVLKDLIVGEVLFEMYYKLKLLIEELSFVYFFYYFNGKSF